MIGERDAMEDLLIAARRGGLSEAEQRGLREALASSVETRLLYEAGCAFDGEAPVLAGDEALIERMVRQVEKQQSRRAAFRPARYVAYGVVLGLLIAGVAAGAIELLRHHLPVSPALPAPASQTTAPSHAHTAPPAYASVPVPDLRSPSPALSTPNTTSAHLTAPHTVDPIQPAQGASSPLAPTPQQPPPSAQFAPLPAPVATTAPALFAAANHARVAGDAAGAIASYRQLESTFPTSNEAVTAHLSLGVLYLQQHQAELALRELQLSRAQSGPAAQADALWGEAQALRQLGRSAEERAALAELVQKYPRSAYAAAAQKRRADLN